jgi:hypothetical protein
MKLFHPVLCLSTGCLGIGAFVLALQRADQISWALPVAVEALFCGLIIASFTAWHSRVR